MPSSGNYYKAGKFQCRSIILKRRKIHNCRPTFRQDSCLRALFLPWREVESRQNTTVSLSWGCQGPVWRGGGSLRNKKGQSSMEEGSQPLGEVLCGALGSSGAAMDKARLSTICGFESQAGTRDHATERWVKVALQTELGDSCEPERRKCIPYSCSQN